MAPSQEQSKEQIQSQTSKDQQPTKSDKSKVQKEEELSEEDQHLKDELELLVERLNEPNQDRALYNKYLDALKTFIKESTTSMTAVPKPLKFLRPHYPSLTELYTNWSNQFLAKDVIVIKLADILSVLATTYSDEGNRDSLKYRLLASDDTISDWGHEYMRHLALEIGESFQENLGVDEELVNKLVKLALQIVPFFLKHNAEADAVDLLLEIECIDKLPQFVDENTFARVCLYVTSCVPYLAPPDDVSFLNTAYSIYLSHNQLTQALTLAIKLDDNELIKQVFAESEDIDYAVECALKAFKSWKKITGVERGKYLYKLADLVEQQRDLLGAMEAWDSGKTKSTNAVFDVDECIAVIRYA